MLEHLYIRFPIDFILKMKFIYVHMTTCQESQMLYGDHSETTKHNKTQTGPGKSDTIKSPAEEKVSVKGST